MRYYFAPMEGVTGAVYRRTHHEYFPGVDKYFMPFITPTTNERLTPRQKRDVASEANAGVPAVPQLLTRTAADFIWAANALFDMGYSEVNLNLGCPSGTVTAKGKGAGFLADPDGLDRFLDAVFAACRGRISVKTRLGMRDPAEFSRLLDIYSRPTLSRLSVSYCPAIRLRHWCSSVYLRISPLHTEFRLPLHHSRTAVSNAGHGLSPWFSHLTCHPAYTPFTPSKSG